MEPEAGSNQDRFEGHCTDRAPSLLRCGHRAVPTEGGSQGTRAWHLLPGVGRTEDLFLGHPSSCKGGRLAGCLKRAEAGGVESLGQQSQAGKGVHMLWAMVKLHRGDPGQVIVRETLWLRTACGGS